jgi:hypothetical protein
VPQREEREKVLTSNRLSIKEQRAKELKKPQSQNKKKKRIKRNKNK